MTPAQGFRGRLASRRLRSPHPATPRAAHDQARRPATIPAHLSKLVELLHSLSGTLRMAQLHAPMQRGDAAVAGRLIKHRIAFCGRGERLRIAFLLYLEGVEAGAQHEHELVAQHLAGGAQLAFVAMAL